jgi:phospholipid/cholesterol/gamma-HCH transport system substrate-binding protein
VGLIVLVLIGGLFSTALWLSVGFNQKNYANYTVYLHESASGLNEQAPVKFNGVQVGFVKSIKLNQLDPRQVEITLSVEEDTPITTSTFATLISQGITGVTYVGLSAGSSDLTPLRKMPGEPYPVIPAKPSLLNQLDTILKEVAVNVNKVSTHIQRIFNEENATYIRNTLSNIDKFTTVIAKNNPNIDKSLKNANIFFTQMAKVSKDFPRLVAKFNDLEDSLETAGANISETMVSGKNTINKISQQAVPPAVLLLRQLNAISANLIKISNEMRQNPSVILRGTKPPKPGPGE